ncbi:MAG: AbrB/MazE/SpoVT family DNA-binding domain-containing protein [Candidatus Njordarchaeales archaeon]
MEEIIEGVIGKKGEIYVKKKLRDILKLRPGDKVEFIVKGKVALFRKKVTPRDLIKMRLAKVDLDDLKKLRRKFEEEMISE